jgi:hypothetical protein
MSIHDDVFVGHPALEGANVPDSGASCDSSDILEMLGRAPVYALGYRPYPPACASDVEHDDSSCPYMDNQSAALAPDPPFVVEHDENEDEDEEKAQDSPPFLSSILSPRVPLDPALDCVDPACAFDRAVVGRSAHVLVSFLSGEDCRALKQVSRFAFSMVCVTSDANPDVDLRIRLHELVRRGCVDASVYRTQFKRVRGGLRIWPIEAQCIPASLLEEDTSLVLDMLLQHASTLRAVACVSPLVRGDVSLLRSRGFPRLVEMSASATGAVMAANMVPSASHIRSLRLLVVPNAFVFHMSGLDSLIIEDAKDVTDSFVRTIFDVCKALRVLELRNAQLVTGSGFKSFIDGETNVYHLVLSNAHRFVPALLGRVGRVKSLRRLVVHNCGHIFPELWEGILDRNGHSLHSLGLCDSRFASMSPVVFTPLGLANPGLRALSLIRMGPQSTARVLAAISHIKQLRALSYDDNNWHSENTVQILLKARFLESLGIHATIPVPPMTEIVLNTMRNLVEAHGHIQSVRLPGLPVTLQRCEGWALPPRAV